MLTAAALCLLMLLTTQPAAAQDSSSFTVEGQIINGTAGAPSLEGVQVGVAALTRERVENTWNGETDAAGHYRVEGVGRNAGAIYLVGVEYGGASYGQRIEPTQAEQLVAPDLTVYEASETDPGIRFERSTVVMARVDEANRTISVFEAHTIENPTDRAFVPRADGPGGARGLLVFGLPSNASDVRAEIGLDPSRLVQIDRGVASLSPLPPGRTEIAFSYRFPYQESAYRFERGIRYPVETFRILAPEAGPAVSSDQLAAADAADIGGQRFRVKTGGPLASGQTLVAQVAGLPVAGGPIAAVPPAAAAVGGATIGLLAVIAAAVRARRNSPAADLAAGREDPVDRLVDLELDRTAGGITAEEYERLRTTILQGLRDEKRRAERGL